VALPILTANREPDRRVGDSATALLTVNNIEVIYDHVILVLKGVSLRVPEGGIVALLGANGAGKSTTLKAISGLLRTERGEVTKGAIEFLGQPIHRRDPADIVRRGIVQVMEGRHVFEHLTVEENLMTGAYTRPTGRAIGADLELVYRYFPRLKDRRTVRAGYVSGGEQQMLAIGRALMARPRLMLLDEPSMGLAPMLVQEIFDIVSRLNREEKLAVLLAEQNASMALRFAQYAYVMESGRIVLDGDARTISENEDVKEFYLGLSGVGHRKSYRDVKHYRRRKRWLS
jgi:branched-chain amino acid transport system ATP-binding protein